MLVKRSNPNCQPPCWPQSLTPSPVDMRVFEELVWWAQLHLTQPSIREQQDLLREEYSGMRGEATSMGPGATLGVGTHLSGGGGHLQVDVALESEMTTVGTTGH